MPLKTDSNGNLILNPLLECTTALVGLHILLALDYAERPEDIGKGGKSVQLGLTPQQALFVAEKLTTLARKILEDDPRTH